MTHRCSLEAVDRTADTNSTRNKDHEHWERRSHTLWNQPKAIVEHLEVPVDVDNDLPPCRGMRPSPRASQETKIAAKRI
jgi:hypothetical protein